MNPGQNQPAMPNPQHNPETFSTSLVQKFDDGRGRSLDDPVVQERERRRRLEADERLDEGGK